MRPWPLAHSAWRYCFVSLSLVPPSVLDMDVLVWESPGHLRIFPLSLVRPDGIMFSFFAAGATAAATATVVNMIVLLVVAAATININTAIVGLVMCIYPSLLLLGSGTRVCLFIAAAVAASLVVFLRPSLILSLA